MLDFDGPFGLEGEEMVASGAFLEDCSHGLVAPGGPVVKGSHALVAVERHVGGVQGRLRFFDGEVGERGTIAGKNIRLENVDGVNMPLQLIFFEFTVPIWRIMVPRGVKVVSAGNSAQQ